MRQKILNKISNSIRLKFSYNDERILEIIYGLETLYITISKTVVIMFINYLFKGFKELMILMLFYGLLRLTGFGLHVKKSWQCWIISLIIFTIIPFLIKYLKINIIIRLIIYLIGTIFILKYAPSDTEKRPLINKRKRTIYKFICTLTAFGLSIYGFISNNHMIQNSIAFSILLESIMISPWAYKIFKLRYNNYKYR